MLRGPSFVGLVGALVFFWFSLTPSLLPRWWVMQAVITGVTAAIGYLIGTTIGVLGSAGVDRFRAAAPAERTRRIAWRLLALATALVVVIGLARWPSVQNDSRDLVDLDHISWTLTVAVALAAAAIFLVVGAVGRVVLYVVRRSEAFAQRFMPRAAAWTITLALVAVIAYILSVDVVERQLISFVDARFGAADTGTAAGVVAPSQPEYSGSPDSLVPWETLGLEGRNFVAGAPRAVEIDAFSGSGTARTPIRVYAGLDSAATLEQRAALVVLELDRTDAADRAAVVVVTTTGTGWVDPDAAAAVEYMYDGDTAIAAMQYSFLPSWIQFLVGTELAGEAGAAINAAVLAWWQALDEPRPKLLLFGESLGSLGLETALSRDSVDESLESLTRSDGVLLTGPTASNPIWQQILAARESSTPVWKPVYDSGATARIANQPQDPDSAGSAGWAEPRVLYFHHPSDPVGYWDLKTLWARPEWVDDPVGYDVSADVGWFPIVTWGQVSGDLIAGFSAGPGFGHNYSVDFVSGWASVAPPQGWTADETARLQAHLEVTAE
jgi:uncharacterized membrane protein